MKLPLLASTGLSLALAAVAPGQLVISEFLAANIDGPEDRDGDRSPWIEVRNTSEEAVDLEGWHVTDDSDDPALFRLPRKVIEPGGYFLLFASDKEEGNSIFSPEIHVSFSIGLGIDYLALVEPDGETVAFEYRDIPRQRAGYSYGQDDYPEPTYFRTPTPGEPNRDEIAGFAAPPRFSVRRGFFDAPFEVEITTEEEDATIYYTTSGRDPSRGSIFTGPIEAIYEGPVRIEGTTVLRAMVHRTGLGPSTITSATYLFPGDVSDQPAMRTAITESPVHGPRMEDALTAIPTVSIAVDDSEPLTRRGQGQSIYEGVRINDYESAISVEWLDPDGGEGFQIDAGVSRFGGYYTDHGKYSYRLYFRKRYGEANLEYPIFRGFERGRPAAEEFDSLNLRSGSHDMQARGAYMSNRYVDDALLEMGTMAPQGRFVHVYINGDYYGQFHLRERWNAAMFASYFGGQEEDYDAINKNDGFAADFKAFDGDREYWLSVEALAREESPWESLRPHVDFDDYHDFMMLWASGNSESEFQAVGSESLGVPFQFYMKDADGWLRAGNPDSGRIVHQGPGSFLGRLRSEGHPDYQMYFADRIHRHHFNGGALTPEQNQRRLQERVDEIAVAFIAESARWGRHTPERWRAFQDNIIENHFPDATEAMLRVFKQRGLYPDDIVAPTFRQHGGEIEPGHRLIMSAGSIFNPQRGDFLYTLDGSDPRLPGGKPAEDALVYDRSGGGIELEGTVTVKARTFVPSLFNNGKWSALNEATFHVGRQPGPGDLVISEIHYRPAAPSAEEAEAGFTSRGLFEFIELYNASADTISLTEVAFTSGIQFVFATVAPEHISLPPGGLVVLASDREAFEHRYGTEIPVAGSFDPFRLSNGGEEVRFIRTDGTILQVFRYNDRDPWPESPDGDGPSLTLVSPQDGTVDAGDPSLWRPSARPGGSPGTLESDDPQVADSDGDGLPAFLEEVLGTSDADPSDGPGAIRLSREGEDAGASWVVTAGGAGGLREDVEIELQVSTDLETWQSAGEDFVLESGADEPLRWRGLGPAVPGGESTLFLRLHVRRGD